MVHNITLFSRKKSAAIIYNECGLCRYKLVCFDEAVADYTRAVELDPSLAAAYYNRGTIHYRLLAGHPSSSSGREGRYWNEENVVCSLCCAMNWKWVMECIKCCCSSLLQVYTQGYKITTRSQLAYMCQLLTTNYSPSAFSILKYIEPPLETLICVSIDDRAV